MQDEAEAEAAFRASLERGIELFNTGAYMEAYEVWEERWSLEVSDGADLLQGLLQMAVGFAKLQGGNPKGAGKLLSQASDKLLVYSPSAYDLNIDALVALVRQWQQIAQRMVEEGLQTLPKLPTLSKTVDSTES